MLPSIKKTFNSYKFLGLLVVGLLLFLSFTNPQNLPIFAVLIVLFWFYLIVSLLSMHILRTLQLKTLSSNRKLILYSFFIGIVPTLVLMLISINQLTAKDLLLLSVLGVIVLLYISRFKVTKS